MAVITERDREKADEVLFGQMVDDVLFTAREQIARLVAEAREQGRQEVELYFVRNRKITADDVLEFQRAATADSNSTPRRE